jgi:hypothetical protein
VVRYVLNLVMESQTPSPVELGARVLIVSRTGEDPVVRYVLNLVIKSRTPSPVELGARRGHRTRASECGRDGCRDVR